MQTPKQSSSSRQRTADFTARSWDAERSQQEPLESSADLLHIEEADRAAEPRQLLLLIAILAGYAGMTQAAGSADMQAFSEREQIITFLVNNPFITLGGAAAAYFILPMLIKMAIRFIIIPLAIGGLTYLAVTNPHTLLAAANTMIECKHLYHLVPEAVGEAWQILSIHLLHTS